MMCGFLSCHGVDSVMRGASRAKGVLIPESGASRPITSNRENKAARCKKTQGESRKIEEISSRRQTQPPETRTSPSPVATRVLGVLRGLDLGWPGNAASPPRSRVFRRGRSGQTCAAIAPSVSNASVLAWGLRVSTVGGFWGTGKQPSGPGDHCAFQLPLPRPDRRPG